MKLDLAKDGQGYTKRSMSRYFDALFIFIVASGLGGCAHQSSQKEMGKVPQASKQKAIGHNPLTAELACISMLLLKPLHQY